MSKVGEIENPTVLDSLWRHNEQPEQKVIGECAGCEEDILSTNDWLELDFKGENYLLHQDPECTYQFVAGMSICRCGEE
jgi:extradiol dioxygenase family protein